MKRSCGVSGHLRLLTKPKVINKKLEQSRLSDMAVLSIEVASSIDFDEVLNYCAIA